MTTIINSVQPIEAQIPGIYCGASWDRKMREPVTPPIPPRTIREDEQNALFHCPRMLFALSQIKRQWSTEIHDWGPNYLICHDSRDICLYSAGGEEDTKVTHCATAGETLPSCQYVRRPRSKTVLTMSGRPVIKINALNRMIGARILYLSPTHDVVYMSMAANPYGGATRHWAAPTEKPICRIISTAASDC